MIGIIILTLSALLLVALTQEAQAYIDPGTGSYIIQLVIGGVFGALFALKIYWTKVKLFFTGLFSKKLND